MTTPLPPPGPPPPGQPPPGQLPPPEQGQGPSPAEAAVIAAVAAYLAAQLLPRLPRPTDLRAAIVRLGIPRRAVVAA